MGSIEETDIHRRLNEHGQRLAAHDTRLSVIEANQTHADEQREAMHESLQKIEDGVHLTYNSLQKHMIEESKDRIGQMRWTVGLSVTIIGLILAIWQSQ